jgi:hypothetical protein
MGIPELWRFDGQIWQIYQLQTGVYQEVENSPTFVGVHKSKLYEFLQQAREDEIGAENSLRQWLRDNQLSHLR